VDRDARFPSGPFDERRERPLVRSERAAPGRVAPRGGDRRPHRRGRGRRDQGQAPAASRPPPPRRAALRAGGRVHLRGRRAAVVRPGRDARLRAARGRARLGGRAGAGPAAGRLHAGRAGGRVPGDQPARVVARPGDQTGAPDRRCRVPPPCRTVRLRGDRAPGRAGAV
ncbi:MAG: hypothetical protein AVDCRST_MAG59-476, partial [uncultured Thermomicrobiales bacterium]